MIACTAAISHAKEKPNVVVMMVDNLGWGELGIYGGGILRGAETPRLDKLAGEGLRFLNFNVEPQCTPSRSAFMTGRHLIRSRTTKVVWDMLYGMTQWEKTIAELMSDAGYATGMFGAPAKLNMPHLYNLIEDPKENYPVDKVDVSASWVFPVVLKKVIEFKKTLVMEPPIRLGTPDPYVPPKR